MRVATAGLALCAAVVIVLQSCGAVAGGGSEDMGQGGAVGLAVALFTLLGGALALTVPWVSVALFAMAGVLALLAGWTTAFRGLTTWAVVAFVLAAMAYVVQRRRSASEPTETP
jgi:hypothetical protein